MNAFPAANYLVNAVFVVCLATVAAGALLAILSARVIRSVCGLALCCIGVAGLYYFLHSPFLALMEILIYVGAVCVTIVFAIMLAEPDEPAKDAPKSSNWLWSGVSLLVAAGIFWGLWHLGVKNEWNLRPEVTGQGTVHDLGKALLSTYSTAFELISLALLVAILGALAVARTGRTKP